MLISHYQYLITIKCDECGFLTRSEDNIKEHKKKKHDKEKAKKDVKEDQQDKENVVFMHSCISCIFKTNDYKLLMEHIEETHQPPMIKKVPCNVCDKMFSDNCEMERHMSEIHSSDKEQ